MKRFLFVICFIIMNCLISFAYETGEEFKVSNNIIVRGEIPSKDNQSKIKTIIPLNTNIKIIGSEGNDWTQIEWYDDTTKKFETGYVANIILNKDNKKMLQNTIELLKYTGNIEQSRMNRISKLPIEEINELINQLIILSDFHKTWNNTNLMNNYNESLGLLYMNRGIRYKQMKLYDKCINDFNEAQVNLSGDSDLDITIYINKGICYTHLGQNQKAKAELINAKKLVNKNTHELVIYQINNYLQYLEEQK